MKCQFCSIESHFRDQIITIDDEIAIVLNPNQHYRGWCWVILRPHYGELFDVPLSLRARLEDAVQTTASVIESLLLPDRMNYAVFCNVVEHVHWNVIPRYKGDGQWGGPPWPHMPLQLELAERNKLRHALAQAIRAKEE